MRLSGVKKSHSLRYIYTETGLCLNAHAGSVYYGGFKCQKIQRDLPTTKVKNRTHFFTRTVGNNYECFAFLFFFKHVLFRYAQLFVTACIVGSQYVVLLNVNLCCTKHKGQTKEWLSEKHARCPRSIAENWSSDRASLHCYHPP